MRVVLSGGGTGGHIYPAISIGQSLNKLIPNTQILFIGSSHGPEGQIATEYGLEFSAIPSSPLTGTFSINNLSALSKLALGIFRALRVLNRFRPDVVIGTGGYTCAAVLLAQKLRSGKLVIHEQNVVPGKTNRFLARWADLVCVSFEQSIRYFRERDAHKIVNTGMPVREAFADLPDKSEARRKLGLAEALFTVLVVGGSQGAKKLNETALEMWELLDDGMTQILHQTGSKNIELLRACAMDGKLSELYKIEGYLDMPLALSSADLVISRSGASTLAEISAAGLPSILVPYPYAFADHQRLNAEVFCSKRAACMVLEKDLQAAWLAEIIAKLREKKSLLASISKRSLAVFGTGVADKIVDEVEKLVRADI